MKKTWTRSMKHLLFLGGTEYEESYELGFFFLRFLMNWIYGVICNNFETLGKICFLRP